MFAIYNNNGLNFRSTIDNLYNLSNVDALARVRNDTKEGLPKDFSVNKKKKLYEGEISSEALKSYKKIANIDIKEPIFHVNQLMTNPVLTIDKNKTVFEAYELMKENNISQLPILDEENNHLIGMIDNKKILDALMDDLEYSEHTSQKSVAMLDIENIITTDPITDIRRVAKVMIDFKLNAMPVVDQNDNLLGIVTRSSVLKAVSNTPPLRVWG